jgi:hypothetical protein
MKGEFVLWMTLQVIRLRCGSRFMQRCQEENDSFAEAMSGIGHQYLQMRFFRVNILVNTNMNILFFWLDCKTTPPQTFRVLFFSTFWRDTLCNMRVKMQMSIGGLWRRFISL